MLSQVGHPVGVSHPQAGLEHTNGVGGGILVEGVTGIVYDLQSKESLELFMICSSNGLTSLIFTSLEIIDTTCVSDPGMRDGKVPFATCYVCSEINHNEDILIDETKQVPDTSPGETRHALL